MHYTNNNILVRWIKLNGDTSWRMADQLICSQKKYTNDDDKSITKLNDTFCVVLLMDQYLFKDSSYCKNRNGPWYLGGNSAY